MKTTARTPAAPLTKQTITHDLDRATSHLVRADHQFHIPGPRQKDHWTAALNHLREARGALEEAATVLEMMLFSVYGPGAGSPG